MNHLNFGPQNWKVIYLHLTTQKETAIIIAC